uniref:Uncharacterized protein n=1 Tax=Rhizophora mucronata TaxID=61149 RepID=A0A2P2P6A9_RHIMU
MMFIFLMFDRLKSVI